MALLTAKKWNNIFSRPPAGEGSSADELGREQYVAAMRSPAPVNWYSNHLGETQRIRGCVYVALKVLADQAASAECKAYKWDPDARMEGDTSAKVALPRDHPVSRIIHRPNRWDTGGMLRRRIVQQLCATGTGLLWRVDDGLSTPRDLWCIPTGTYQPVGPCPPYPDGAYRIMPWYPGPLAYIPGAWSAGGVVVGASHIVAIRLPHPLVQHEGFSPLSACNTEMDTIDSINTARYSMARRRADPSAMVECDGAHKLPDGPELTRLRADLTNLLGGPNKAGAIGILPPGLALKPWEHGTVEVGWIESWNQLVSFVLSVFGVTRSLAFLTEDASYATLYAMLKQFNLFTLCPLLDMISEGLNIQLVEPYFGEEYFIELVPKKIDDHQIVEQQLTTDLRAGLRTVNEIRKLRGLEHVKEPWGEERAYAAWNPQIEQALKMQKQAAEQQQQAEGQAVEQNGVFPAGPEGQEEPTPAPNAPRPANPLSRGSLPPRSLTSRGGFARNGAH